MIEALNQRYEEISNLKNEVKKQEDAFLTELTKNNFYLKNGKILENEEIYAIEYDLLYYDTYVSEKGSLIQQYKGLIEINLSKANLINGLIDTLANEKYHPEQFDLLIRLIGEQQEKDDELEAMIKKVVTATKSVIKEVLTEMISYLFVNDIAVYSNDLPDDYVLYSIFSNESDVAFDPTLNLHYFERKEENYNQGDLNKGSYFKIIKTSKENKCIGKYTQKEYID